MDKPEHRPAASAATADTPALVALQARVEELEVRYTFAVDEVEQLSGVIYELRQTLDATRDQLKQLERRLERVDAAIDPVEGGEPIHGELISIAPDAPHSG
jgi:uncharacterized coiled-coil protein SlyX